MLAEPKRSGGEAAPGGAAVKSEEVSATQKLGMNHTNGLNPHLLSVSSKSLLILSSIGTESKGSW